MRRSKTWSLLAGAVVLAVLAGCGSSGGASSVPAKGSDGPSGAPIKLFQYGMLKSTVASFPELESGALAAVKAINADGGVGGRPLALDSCNDEADANKALACARKGIASGAIADVGTVSIAGAQVLPLFEAAKMPYVAPSAIAPIEKTSKYSFLIDGSTLTSYGGIAPWADRLVHAKKIAVVYSDNASKPGNQVAMRYGTDKVGQSIVKEVTLPLNTIDLSPYISQLRSSGADAVFGALTPDDVIKYWKAAKAQGMDVPFFTIVSTLDAKSVAAAGGGAEGSYLVSQFPDVAGDEPSVVQFRKDMEKYSPGAALNPVSLRAYGGVQLVAAALRTVKGEPTKEALQAALERFDGKFLWIPHLSFSDPGPFTSAPRAVVSNAWAFRVKGTTFAPLGNGVPIEL
ncbi:MAG: hypothetical protein JWO68_2804 [Actinomycetia bacterium]|nr:hypothetical protein [Actinomycetes bacterium]